MTWVNPTVRGEPVTILQAGGEKSTGVLGATVRGADVLVEYPGGEQGYVRESDITEGR